MAEFVYLNVNPDERKISDCVTRAISLATGLPYSEIRKKLYHTAELLDCEKLCMTCYKFLIEDVFMFRPVNCDGFTVRDFANIYNDGIYLLRMNGHITVIIDGVCYDIWNCLDKEITNAWQVE